MIKKIRYFLEFIFAFLIVFCLKLLPIWLASNICGFLFRYLMYFVCHFTGENKRGIEQIGFAFPNLTNKERVLILKDSYENTGRFVAEYINQHKMTKKWLLHNVELKNFENLTDDLKKSCVYISGHFGNWEVIQRFSKIIGEDLNVVYNPIKNPFINNLYLKHREVRQIPKGSGTMKDLINLIKTKKLIGILIDQRDKQGAFFTFFRRDAKTSTAIQKLCVKYNYPILPIKCERKANNKNKFILTVCDPLKTDEQNSEKAINDLTNQSLKVLEDWIIKNPSNWILWTYSRWRSKF